MVVVTSVDSITVEDPSVLVVSAEDVVSVISVPELSVVVVSLEELESVAVELV